MNYFQELRLEKWRQFHSIYLNLSEQTTVITGANGCGKTTILNVLSQHFGWSMNFVSTPFMSTKKGKKLFSDFLHVLEEEFIDSPNSQVVGSILYQNGSSCELHTPQNNNENAQYQLNYKGQQTVTGLHIPSHRPSITYQRVDNIPTNPKNNQQHYQEFQQLLLQTYGSANVRNPGLVLKQSLISLALFGYGNQYVSENIEYKNLFDEFQKILRIILPKNIGFQRLEIRMPDVVLITSSGEFSLDAMSGGVNSLFGIAWQIHMYGADKDGCTVIIDEPENHLHPSMQRTLLPSLEKAFPKYKFIIATHSPFIVTSNPNANVFALTYDERSKINSIHLESADLSSSPERVLRDILDVPITIPIWVEEKIREILIKYKNQNQEYTYEQARAIYAELKEVGLNESLPQYYDDGGRKK